MVAIYNKMCIYQILLTPKFINSRLRTQCQLQTPSNIPSTLYLSQAKIC